MDRTGRGFLITCLAAAALRALQPGAWTWPQNGTGGQGGYDPGGYDVRAIQPAAANWARQTALRAPAAGTVRWTVECGRTRVANPSDQAPGLALGRDGTVYAGVPGADGGRLCALAPDGRLRWSTPLPGGGGSFTDVGVGAPAIAPDGTLRVQSGGGLHAVGPDGARRWTVPLEQDPGAFHVTPALAPDGTIYAAAAGGALAAFRPEDGRRVWTLETVRVTGAPVLGRHGALYVLGRTRTGAGTRLFAVRTADGSLTWQADLGDQWPYGSAAPALDRDGRIHVGQVEAGLDGAYVTRFHAYGWDGTRLWSTAVPGESRCGPALGPDGTVVVCTTLAALGLDPGDGAERWRWAAPAGQEVLAGTPIVDCDGSVLLVSRHGLVVALDARGRERWRARCPEAGPTAAPALGPGGRVYVGIRAGSGREDRFLVSALGDEDLEPAGGPDH